MSAAVGFSGVGRVTFFERLVTGLPGLGTFMGNCPKLGIKHNPNVVERNSSMDTSRAPLRRMTQTTGANAELVCDEFNKKNFARFVNGRIDNVAQQVATVQSYTCPAGAAVGDTLMVPNARNLNNVSIIDSSGTPKTLPPASYESDDFAGTYRLLDITTGGAYVQPFKITYKRGAVDVIAGLVVPDPEIWISMAGTNADNGDRGVLDIYRVRLSIAESLEFINNDYQDFTITGSVLQDTTKAVSDVGGNYYKFTQDASAA